MPCRYKIICLQKLRVPGGGVGGGGGGGGFFSFLNVDMLHGRTSLSYRHYMLHVTYTNNKMSIYSYDPHSPYLQDFFTVISLTS